MCDGDCVGCLSYVACSEAYEEWSADTDLSYYANPPKEENMFTLVALVDRNGFHDQMSWLEKSFLTVEDALTAALDGYKYLSECHDADVQIWVTDEVEGGVWYHIHDELNLDPYDVGYPTDPHYLYVMCP